MGALTGEAGPRQVQHWFGAPVSGGPTMRRHNPAAPDDVVAIAPAGDAAVVDAAVGTAVAAQAGWAALPLPARGAVLLRAAALLQGRLDEVARDLVREEGKTLAEATGEVARAAEILQFYSGAGRQPTGEVLPSSVPGTHVYTRREPMGVVGLITPWNFPIAIPTWKSAPALIAGNGVVLKPAELTPLSVWHLASVLDEAGLPPGVFNIVYGTGRDVGAPLADHPDIAALSFTGSNAVGRDVGRRMHDRRARVQLEMGGKNALVVLDDADPAAAARIAAVGGFGLTGQACTATSRVICTPGIHDAFVAALASEAARYTPGNGLDEGVLMGPVVSDDQLRKDLDWLDIATGQHAEVAAGGAASGRHLAPTILTGVRPAHRVAREEVFGPIVSVLRATDFDDAIAIANDVEFGLSASIVTNDLRRAHDFIARARAGVVKVNRPTGGVDPNVPFGGIKESSSNTFREQGSQALDFFSWTKSVYLGHSD